MANFDSALAYVLLNEGGYQANINDTANANGGATNMGITLGTLTAYQKQLGLPAATVADIKALPLATASAIYKKSYWGKILGDQITDLEVATVLFDASVLTGVGAASGMAQHVMNSLAGAGLKEDSVLGPVSIAALNKLKREQFIPGFAAGMQSYFVAICARNPSQTVFLKGWLKRAAYWMALIPAQMPAKAS